MKNNNRKVAQKYQWPYLWIRIYIFTLDEEQDKINTVMEDRKLSEKRKSGYYHSDDQLQQAKYESREWQCVALLGVFYRALIGRDILFDSVYAKLYLVLGMDAHVCCRTGYFI